MMKLVILTFVILNAQFVFSYLPPLPSWIRGNDDFNAADTDRIVGGNAARLGELPYQVSLRSKSLTGVYHHFCGATLISPSCVVTAAHCALDRRVSNLFVFGGTTSLENGTALPVQSVTINPAYDADTVVNDIAIIKLVSPVVATQNFKPLEIAKDKVQTAEGVVTTVSGWGTLKEGSGLSDDLMYVEVPIVSDARCQDLYGRAEIVESMICAGIDEGGKDSCQGDSGGPLVAGTGDSRRLVGIVSWGFGCARPKFPGVYTEVSYFTEFINQQGC